MLPVLKPIQELRHILSSSFVQTIVETVTLCTETRLQVRKECIRWIEICNYFQFIWFLSIDRSMAHSMGQSHLLVAVNITESAVVVPKVHKFNWMVSI